MKALFAFLLLPFLALAQKEYAVNIHLTSNPDRLNPLTASNADVRNVSYQIFSRLLEYDAKTLDLKPQLAVSRPVITLLKEGEYAGGMSLEYEIQPDAVWDNGSPITAQDYIFTVKAIKNPKVNSASFRTYLEFIKDIKVDAQNPKKFTIYSKETYFVAESSSGDLFVLPEYIYDPKGLMRNFEISQLNAPENKDSLLVNPTIITFANDFHATKYDKEIGSVVGSGAYQLVEWKHGLQITLQRKKDWWGDKAGLKAYPDKLVYKIIPDIMVAVEQMRRGQLDVIIGMKPSVYNEMLQDADFKNIAEMSTPNQFSYYYIGFNTKNPKFSDPLLRRAFAHLVNRDEIIENVFNGMAIKTNSPINPNKPHYNKDLKDIEFDIEAAKKLLAKAGWKDTDKDGILDKKINGVRVPLKVEYKYNEGNTMRKNIGLLLKDEASRVGIEVTVVAKEWSVFLDEVKKRNFELISLAWVQGPDLDDLKQIWHTNSDTPEGSNRVGFGDKKSDEIIDKIRYTLDEATRNKMYMQIQQIIYDQQPYIFICVPSERIAISKKFTNIETHILRPGFEPHLFQLR